MLTFLIVKAGIKYVVKVVHVDLDLGWVSILRIFPIYLILLKEIRVKIGLSTDTRQALADKTLLFHCFNLRNVCKHLGIYDLPLA